MTETPIVHVVHADLPSPDVVFVERKGVGHPDTLADHLAELLSQRYSQFTLKNYGAVLHHNFDKLGILGGKSSVSFGRGELVAPIRVLINGRVSTAFGDEEVPYERILVEAVFDLFASRFGDLIPKDMISVELNISNASSPGHSDLNDAKGSTRTHWFTPRSLDDLPELRSLFANDTSLGCGYYPLHSLEQFVLKLEAALTNSRFAAEHAWMGTDVKIMATRLGSDIDVTLCIPQIARHVSDVEHYKRNLRIARAYIEELAEAEGHGRLSLSVNTRDNYTREDLYLTATGSAIESGDEGLVGRGNRVNGVISPGRPMSMEGASGKNPVYHVGKLYNVAAYQIAEALYKEFSLPNEVYLISQSGRRLTSPWKAVVKLDRAGAERSSSRRVEQLVASQVLEMPELTRELIQGQVAIA